MDEFKIMADEPDSAAARPETLGAVLNAGRRLVVWCRSCGHLDEPDLAALVARHGSDAPVARIAATMACARCNGRDVDTTVIDAPGGGGPPLP